MDSKHRLFNIHEFYNSSRYLFLNIEWNYSKCVKETGITLPQLRVLWIIKIFSGISLVEISKIGCWSPPAVTKMIRLLMDKELVIHEETSNKKLYNLKLTEAGCSIIKMNQLNKQNNFALFDLVDVVNITDLNFVIELFKAITVQTNNIFLFEYIEKLNELELKIDFAEFTLEDKFTLQQLICFYDMLRTFILTVENKHRQLLSSLNLTYPQLRALWIINAFPGITSVKLSELAFLAPSTANVIVKNLYEKKLIYKEKSDLKNSLFLYISKCGEELLIKDFIRNQKSFLIYEDIEFLSINELSKLNEFVFKMNMALKNTMVKSYIEKTFNEIEKMHLDI